MFSKNSFVLYFLFLILGLLSSPFGYAQSLDANVESEEHLEENLESLKEKFGSPAKKVPANGLSDTEKSIDLLLDHYSRMSVSQVEDEILKNSTSHSVKQFLTDYPKFRQFFAHLLKDKIALKKLFLLAKETDKLKVAGLWFLGTILLGFILNKILFSSGQNFFSKIRAVILRTSILWACRIFIIFHFYGDNLRPTFEIARKVFL